MQEISIQINTEGLTKQLERNTEFIKLIRQAFDIRLEIEQTWNPFKIYSLWKKLQLIDKQINNFDFNV